MKKPTVSIRVPNMSPNIFGVIGLGFLKSGSYTLNSSSEVYGLKGHAEHRSLL